MLKISIPYLLKLKFKYKFQIVADGKYGNIDTVTGEWNGMIRELQDQVKTSIKILENRVKSIQYSRGPKVEFLI
jgi:hypothetical protein